MNYFNKLNNNIIMEHLVKQIYDFFMQNPKSEGKNVTLYDFLVTLPGFKREDSEGYSVFDMGMANKISSLCKKMASQDILLMSLKTSSMLCLYDEYMSFGKPNIRNYDEFIQNLNYGVYDFKYQGFVYTRNWFERSVLPIAGVKINGDEDMGTAYYIGGDLFVTAAHCVNGLERFNLLLDDKIPVKLREVWFAEDKDSNDYDLAIIVADEQIRIPALLRDEPFVLDPVLVMGYPPIPGMFPIQTAETASVGAYVKPNQKAAVGQVISPTKSYFSDLDYFIINARIKGGNSGGPVINESGKVIGTVVQIPFDNQGGSSGGRYDIMGYGVCLPSKYIDDLIYKHIVTSLVAEGEYFAKMNN